MTKELAIIAAKQFRKEADDLLQRMKGHTSKLKTNAFNLEVTGAMEVEMTPICDNIVEVIAQHIISIRDLESCIMRQGMALKYIGNPDPYPNSKDPSNTIVEPTSDNLKL